MAIKLIYNNGPEVRKHGLRQFNVTKVADNKVAAILAELGDQVVVVDHATKKVEHCGSKVSAYFKMKFAIKDQTPAPAVVAPAPAPKTPAPAVDAVSTPPEGDAPVEDKPTEDAPEEDAAVADDEADADSKEATPSKRGRKKKDVQDAE